MKKAIALVIAALVGLSALPAVSFAQDKDKASRQEKRKEAREKRREAREERREARKEAREKRREAREARREGRAKAPKAEEKK